MKTPETLSHVNCIGGVSDGKVNVETLVQYLVIVTKPQPVVFLSFHDWTVIAFAIQFDGQRLALSDRARDKWNCILYINGIWKWCLCYCDF